MLWASQMKALRLSNQMMQNNSNNRILRNSQCDNVIIPTGQRSDILHDK